MLLRVMRFLRDAMLLAFCPKEINRRVRGKIIGDSVIVVGLVVSGSVVQCRNGKAHDQLFGQ